MKWTKTRLRNALGEDMLQWILITESEGPKRITNIQPAAVQETTRIEQWSLSSSLAIFDYVLFTVLDMFKSISGTERYIHL